MRSITRIRDGARICRSIHRRTTFSSRRSSPIDNGDDLIEEYSGFGLRFESRKLGTERLGVFFEWSTYDQTWRDATLAAMALRPDVPPLYRNRMNVTPLVKFAITPQVTVGGGVSITELDALLERAVADGERRHWVHLLFTAMADGLGPAARLEASFTVARRHALAPERSRLRALPRRGRLRVQPVARHRVLVSAMGGPHQRRGAAFRAILARRFTTLRGWDKYDIAPAGGDRMFYASVEYRYHGLAMFLDSGSVWNSGTEQPGPRFDRVRLQPGPGVLHARLPAQHRRVPCRLHDGCPVP